ncbi:hypothetical protein FRX31_018852 [Thalictrum thalictroides]|uniref:Uncharacterized protein n=1 Tax=Thalictrum thalictroides TaxID=46969 RepID=A0A7J6W2G0_THATH|nr:hypothetical protein FRX31_018852 [Thalictrum thalictroides]
MVRWVLEKPLIDLVKEGRNNLRTILKQARDYVRYKERMRDFSIQDVIERINTTQNIHYVEAMTEGRTHRSSDEQNGVGDIDHIFWEMLDISMQWMQYRSCGSRLNKSDERQALFRGKIGRPFNSSLSDSPNLLRPIGASTYAGGILWDDDVVSVFGAVQSINAIHVVVTMKPEGNPWMMSAIYANPHKSQTKILWKEMEALSLVDNVGWLSVGDFNCFKAPMDKMGGATFTWINKRQGLNNIQEKLDHVLANPTWNALFPAAKRRSPPKDNEPQDGGATNHIHPKEPATQVHSRPLQQQKTWQVPKGRKVYRPVVVHQDGEGTSGTKDSLGREIQTPAIHPDNQVPSPEMDHVTEPANNNEVSNLPVTTSNSFAALEANDDYPSGQEQNTTPTAFSPDSETFREEEPTHARYEDTDILVQKESTNEGVASPVNSTDSPAQEDSPPAHIPSLAQVSHSQVMDMQLQMHDNGFLFPPNPPLLTYGGPDEEVEESYDNQHTVVTYGSDSEVIVKAKKTVPPLSILTRSKTQGQPSISKKSFSCCRDC